MAVVLARSYSRNSGSTSLEADTWKPASRRTSAVLSSCSGRVNENRRQTATASTPRSASSPTSRPTSRSASGRSASPSGPTRSSSSKHRSAGTSGAGRSSNRS
jgi:hypothetical protein